MQELVCLQEGYVCPQCLSAPPSHALSEGDAPAPLGSITLAGRTETHALSAVCTTPPLPY